MAHAKPAPEGAVYPIAIHWTQARGFWITPGTNQVPLSDTVRFSTDTNCTVYFSPTSTVFGASLNVNVGTSVDVQASANLTVNVCVVAQGAAACDPDARIKDTPMGTIKVGSGMRP